eukprot:GFUD01127633.1.p1 GENE.GFUD01127633.1~~GFUD01127633.1.p1  ORF type:complete len:836 (+),score=161.16 GFUD01127633.1:310-2508(+)
MDKHCVKGQGYCWSGGKTDCYCCPPHDPVPCEDQGCRAEGGHCVKESQSGDCSGIHRDAGLCVQNGKEQCLCCLNPPKPCNQTSPECERRGPGYSCVPREEAADWPVPCDHSCHHNGDKNCRCCPPKPSEVECNDTGCSTEHPGYECKNESVAASWPKRCLESDQLCSSITEPYEVNMTVDNAFQLFGDGILIGSGSDFQDIFTFTTDASEVLAIFAWNWSGPVGILLSTSTGVVTDSSWKCIDSQKVTSPDWSSPGFNDMSWPYAVTLGYNVVQNPPLIWGIRLGIYGSAQWIWAPGSPAPQKVYCRKQLETTSCFCCPPIPPVNKCTENGCEAAFGEGSVGECVDVTNPDFGSLGQPLDLLATPTGKNLCNNTLEESCCRCFKKKPCLDDGCQGEFGGNGICVDVDNDDLSVIDFSVEKKLGLCKNTLKKNCCFCYKKHSKPYCPHKDCSFKGVKGQCVGPMDRPPLDHVKTAGDCGGKDCICWVPDRPTCSRDPVCEESLHGRCVPDGKSLPHHKPSTYKCQSLTHYTEERNCTCWTPDCQHPDCRESAGAQCILPQDRVPPGYQPNGLVCNKELDCKCYARKPCDPTDECTKVGGKCGYPDDRLPNEMEGDFCNQAMGCKCYYTKPCTNPDCTDAGGICVSPGKPVSITSAYSYKPGDFCDRNTDCKCYRPKCTNPRCTKLGGRCFMKGMTIPAGSKPIMKGKKPFNCKKNCQCMKVPTVIGGGGPKN